MRLPRRPCAALLLALVLPATAKETDERPFIERTFVEVPRTLGEYTLTDARDFPGQVDLGVSFAYDIAGAPDVALSLYVYPAGRLPAAQALQRGMADVEGGVREYERQGVYEDVRFDAATDFALPGATDDLEAAAGGPDASKVDTAVGAAASGAAAGAPAADTARADIAGAGTAAPGTAPAGTVAATDTPATAGNDTAAPGNGDPDAVLRALAEAEAADAATAIGRRRSHAFVRDGTAGQSLSYLFYRHLMLVKVRISAPRSAHPPEEFAALADRAVTTLVPAIAVTNVGGCATIGVAVDGTPDDTMRALVGGAAQARREGCSGEPPDAPAPADRERLELVYAADTWKSGP